MNAPEKDLADSDPKAKTEIKKGLSNAHNISEESKKKHVKLLNDLETTNARLREFEEKEKEHGLLRKDLEDANSRIKELEGKEKEHGSLRRDLENANSRIRELKEKEKEHGSLRRDLENANKRIMELEEKEKELETLQKDSQKETSTPKEQMADIQNTEETFPEYGSHGKEAFRIDLYPHEGHYQGKVEHLLTKEKKAFKGIDHKAISDFINEHLPQPEESVVVTPEPVATVPAKPAAETQIQVFKTGNIRKFTLVQEGKFQKEMSIPHDQIFQVALVIDPRESIAEVNLPFPYNISVYGKRMGGGFKQILGKSKGKITTAGEFAANVHCAPLPAGIYRFVAFGTISIKNDGQESIIQFHKSSIFSVI